MAITTTFSRPRPAGPTDAAPARDLTPSALGALGTIVVVEDPAADGGATCTATMGAYSWTAQNGVAIDPRTGRPFFVAPWVPAYPENLLDLLTALPLSAYLTTTATTYAGLLAALSAKLGQWGWTSETTTD